MKNFYFVISTITESFQPGFIRTVDTESQTPSEAVEKNWYDNVINLQISKIRTDVQYCLPLPLDVKALSTQLTELFGYSYCLSNWERVTNGVKSVQHGFTVLYHSVDCNE